MARWAAAHPSRIPESNEVHVWSAELDIPAPQLHVLEHYLSPDELQRADRLVAARDRSRFITSHGILRAVLGGYLGCAPSALRFRRDTFGKPSLVRDGSEPTIRFNFSHSQSLALCAVALGREVGVDIERIESSESLDEMAARYFSAREVAALRSLHPAVRREAFYACWSRKEAYIKGRGPGLSMRLDSFDVSLLPGEPAALLDDRSAPPEHSGWKLFALDPASDYAAALAVEGKGDDIQVSCHSWAGVRT